MAATGWRSSEPSRQDADYRGVYESLFGPLPDFGDRDRFPENASPLTDTDARAAWDGMSPDDQVLINTAFCQSR